MADHSPLRYTVGSIAVLSGHPLLYYVVGSIAIVAGSFIVMYTLGAIANGIAKRAGTRKTISGTIRDLVLVVWAVIAITGVAAFTGLASEFTALTVSGIVGLTVSLALQNTITNMIAGITLLSDSAIRVGDIIECQGVKGKVIRTALRNTWIQAEDGKIAIIGNSTLSSGPLVNHTATDRLLRKVGSD